MMQLPLFPELFQISEIEISYRNPVSLQDRMTISSNLKAYEIFRYSWDRNKIELVEEFKILLINRANHFLGIVNISSGSGTNCSADPRLIFAAAMKANATAIVLAHNHPSGSLSPSDDDIETTKNIVKAGKLLGITVLDHNFLSADGFFSFGANRIMPK